MVGPWHLSQSQFMTNQLTKIGSGILTLKVTSNLINSTATIQKKILTPQLVHNVHAKMNVPLETQSVLSQGSEYGTSSQGKIDALSLYKAELRAMIDKNKYYPAMSRRLGQTGIVVVAFTLLEDGHIIDVRIDKPSRFESLNLCALDAVKKVERFRPLPKEFGENRIDIKVPIKFVSI